jgi:hypothetical protein
MDDDARFEILALVDYLADPMVTLEASKEEDEEVVRYNVRAVYQIR